MTIILMLAAWTAMLLLIVGLCTTAHVGDRDQRANGQPSRMEWQPTTETVPAQRPDYGAALVSEEGAPSRHAESIAA